MKRTVTLKPDAAADPMDWALAPLDRLDGSGPAPGTGTLDGLSVCCAVLAEHLQPVSPAPRPSTDEANAPSADARDELRRHGLRSRPVRLRDGWHRKPLHPLLARWQDGTPVALLPRRSRYRLIDPTSRFAWTVTREDAALIEPWAYEVTRPLDGRGRRSLLRHATRRRDLLLLAAVGLVTSVFAVAVPATGSLALIAVLGDRTGMLRELAVLVGAGIGMYAGLLLLRNLVVARLESRAGAVAGPAVLDRVLRAFAWDLGAYSTGDLVQRLTGIDVIQRMLGTTLLSGALNLTFAGASLVLIVVIAPVVGALAALAALLVAAVVISASRRQLRYDRAVYAAYGRNSTTLLETLRALDKIRVTGREPQAFRRWLAGFVDQKHADLSAAQWQSVSSGAIAILPSLLYVVMFIGPSLTGSSLSAAGLLAINIAIGQFLAATVQTGQLVTTLTGAVPVVDRLVELASLPSEKPGDDPGRPATFQMRGVSVTTPTGTILLSNVDLYAAEGEFVGIVGPSGAGKSTLVRALLGLVQVSRGEILMDGRDLARLDVAALRRGISAVLQDTPAVGADIRQVVAAGRPDVDDATIWRVLQDVGLAAEVRVMPMGLSTPVGAGGRLVSGGQRQRLLLARAMAGRPRLIILDEATSALDSRTEAGLLQRLADTGATRIVVTHRLRVLRNADRILVLDRGHAVAQGRFDELAWCSLFRSLVGAGTTAATKEAI